MPVWEGTRERGTEPGNGLQHDSFYVQGELAEEVEGEKLFDDAVGPLFPQGNGGVLRHGAALVFPFLAADVGGKDFIEGHKFSGGYDFWVVKVWVGRLTRRSPARASREAR